MIHTDSQHISLDSWTNGVNVRRLIRIYEFSYELQKLASSSDMFVETKCCLTEVSTLALLT